MKHAIVTDGLWRKSLSAIRSLGKAEIRVTVMGDSRLTTGFWSAFTSKRVIAPTAAHDPEGFGAALLQTLEQNPGSILLPMEDASMNWVSANRERILKAGGIFLIPPDESLRIAQDKSRTLTLAGELGIPAPRTWKPELVEECEKIVAGLSEGSYVVKPRTGSGSSGIVYFNARGLDTGALRSHWERFGPLMIQERISSTGRGLGVSVLMSQESRCLAFFAHERLQQYPNSGGPSTDRRGIKDPKLVELSVRMLEALKWKGVAMVEWKEDPGSGQPKLMEINPRFWGSLELAVRSSVDFPVLYARVAAGEQVVPVHEYREGLRCRWLIPGEILRFLTQPRSTRESFWKFLQGLPGLAEEWDTADLRGLVSAVICTGLLALNPRYWRYVRRG